ncbi:hypothetical protein [Nonomuraea indica]|uniref:hypothetical protein n=1 Tax=Nonomuraea indica TaxID=1581193 RepID=UPI0011841434|nr:hypothetical protein [Nonomuraea indica]
MLKALLALLNGKSSKFELTGEALEAAEKADVPVDYLKLHFLIKALGLYIRMRFEHGLDGDWRP